MKKWVYIICFLLIFVIAIFTGKYLYNYFNKENDNTVQNENYYPSEIEVNDEYVNEVDTIQTITEEEKISPNAVLVLKKQYIECGHTIKEYSQIPEDLVNLNKEQLIKEYPDWEIDNFSSLEVDLLKQVEGVCNEHYILRDNEGIINVYKINNDGQEVLFEDTGISTEYLTINDKMKIEEGIKVYGKEELNSVLEDYE